MSGRLRFAIVKRSLTPEFGKERRAAKSVRASEGEELPRRAQFMNSSTVPCVTQRPQLMKRHGHGAGHATVVNQAIAAFRRQQRTATQGKKQAKKEKREQELSTISPTVCRQWRISLNFMLAQVAQRWLQKYRAATQRSPLCVGIRDWEQDSQVMTVFLDPHRRQRKVPDSCVGADLLVLIRHSSEALRSLHCHGLFTGVGQGELCCPNIESLPNSPHSTRLLVVPTELQLLEEAVFFSDEEPMGGWDPWRQPLQALLNELLCEGDDATKQSLIWVAPERLALWFAFKDELNDPTTSTATAFARLRAIWARSDAALADVWTLGVGVLASVGRGRHPFAPKFRGRKKNVREGLGTLLRVLQGQSPRMPPLPRELAAEAKEYPCLRSFPRLQDSCGLFQNASRFAQDQLINETGCGKGDESEAKGVAMEILKQMVEVYPEKRCSLEGILMRTADLSHAPVMDRVEDEASSLVALGQDLDVDCTAMLTSIKWLDYDLFVDLLCSEELPSSSAPSKLVDAFTPATTANSD